MQSVHSLASINLYAEQKEGVVRSQCSYGFPNPILFDHKTDNTPDNTLNPHSRQWPIGVNIVHVIAPIMLNLIACANTEPVFLSRKVPIDDLLNR